jgi:predicted nucleic acid-binding protein
MALIKALIDTNIVLDALLCRLPFYDNARDILTLTEQHQITGCISSSAVTDIFYLINKEVKNTSVVYHAIEGLTQICTVIPVFDTTIRGALALRWKDFEDAVQYTAALENDVTRIVTRNASDYEAAGIAVSPPEFLSFVHGTQKP